jgi:hypothetical protein
MGLQFLNLSLDEMNTIRDYLRSGTLEPHW